MKRRQSWNISLPLFSDVVFVDWHGVMSSARFWNTYTAPEGGPGFFEVRDAVARLFANEALVERWMRGGVSSSEIVRLHLFDQPLSVRHTAALVKSLIDECEAAKTDHFITASIKHLRQSRHVVLATDNMDGFVEGIRLRGDLGSLFDDYISSSEVGVLKAEDPQRFFGEWLNHRGLDIRRAILIDDSASNCDAFEGLGGSAIRFGGPDSMADIYQLIWPHAV